MKSNASSKKFPNSSAQWEELIAAAPGKSRTLTAKEEAAWATAVVVKGGGYAAVKAAVAEAKKRGQRGKQIAPTKQLVSVRYSPEVLSFFKATGAGWQTRMDDALKEWVSSQAGQAAH